MGLLTIKLMEEREKEREREDVRRRWCISFGFVCSLLYTVCCCYHYVLFILLIFRILLKRRQRTHTMKYPRPPKKQNARRLGYAFHDQQPFVFRRNISCER